MSKANVYQKNLQKNDDQKIINKNDEKCKTISNDAKKSFDSKKWTNIKLSLIILNVIKQNIWENSKISNVHRTFNFQNIIHSFDSKIDT